MRRVAALNLVVFTIVAVSLAEAQSPDVSSAGPELDLAGLALSIGGGQATPTQPVQPPPPPPRPRPRRRGSMVGYIEDPRIESKIRVRFDLGYENTVPDRAEFFYAKCGCYVTALGPANDPDAPGPRPGAANDLDFQQLYFYAEYALASRFSAFGQLPFRWIQPKGFVGGGTGFSDQSGVEDLRAGVKMGLLASDAQSLTAQVRFFFPTGAEDQGLGTGHASVEPALLYYQSLNDVVAIESQLGVWLPVKGAAPVPITDDGHFAGNVLFYGIGPSFVVYRGESVQFAPVVELVGWRVLDGYQTGSPEGNNASGTNIVNLKFGARAVAGRGSLYIGYGKALTDETWYDDIVRFEYRYEF